jgi:hypothetical protein
VPPQALFALRNCYSTLAELEARMRSKPGIPSHWQITGRASVVHDQSLDCPRCARAHSENTLIEALFEVSYQGILSAFSPTHLRSRLYSHLPCQIRFRLSKEQVADLVAPYPETLNLVNSWFAHHGASSSRLRLNNTRWQLTGAHRYARLRC